MVEITKQYQSTYILQFSWGMIIIYGIVIVQWQLNFHIVLVCNIAFYIISNVTLTTRYKNLVKMDYKILDFC